MKRKNAFLLAVILIIPLFSIGLKIETTQAQIDSQPEIEDTTFNVIEVGQPAPDFNITDVDTRENYTLSEFQGQMVLLDFWATWCGPCEISLPYIREFYDMYPRHVLQIISVDVDEEETDAQVSAFRESHDMDWIVGIDYDTSIWADYSTGYVPTFCMVDPNGDVQLYFYGIDTATFYDVIFGVISQYFIDEEEPTFNELSVQQKETEFSIYHPYLKVEGNISDNWNVGSVEVTVTTSLGSEIYPVTLEKFETYILFNSTISITPNLIYPDDEIQVEIAASDYFENTNTSDPFTISVTHYADTGPPIIEDISYSYETIDDNKYKVELFVQIVEDLMLTKTVVYLATEDKIVKSLSLEEYNSTHMSVSAIILKTMALPEEIIINITLEDVAGNIVEESYKLVPEDTNFITIFTIMIFLISVSCIIKRRRR